MDDLIQEFITETTEGLNALDADIVRLEQNPGDAELIGRIFRIVHTIKGTCGFLGLPRLETVAHRSENIMGRYRDGTLSVTADSVSLILEALDRIKLIVSGIATSGKEPEGDDTALIAKLDAVFEGKTVAIAPKAATSTIASVPATEDKFLRVGVDVLETLMTMVSELVLTRNEIVQLLRTHEDSPFAAPLQRLNHVVSDLQESVMQTRMQPIGNAWGKLPRIIRDISVELGKKINLDMRGSETELDRQVLELIKDPLTHMIRNSADHGIETPADRKAAGKPEEGTILLNAFHEGGHVIIEITDDGRGLNTDRIRKKIIEKNIAPEEQVRGMTDSQIQQFIFAPGFSTAEQITSVSGRGVGMDVVRTNIEKIGGAIEMKSTWTKGTTFTIKIPLTLAIVSALIVESGGERYAIPQICVKELVRLSATGDTQLEEINGTPVMRLRGRLLPLSFLDKILDTGEGHRTKERQVIVMQAGAASFGIIVDRIFDTEEIVVKPVSPVLKGIRVFSGNTVLGDGSVIMILDPNGISAAIGVLTDVEEENRRSAATTQALSDSARKTPLLVFRAGGGAPRAVPLSLITRLEEFDPAKIETSSGCKVVQYGGKLMPLIPCSEKLSPLAHGGQTVLVFSDKERMMGLMVDEIIDIVEEHINIEIASARHQGTIGSAIINGQATDVIDICHFTQLAHPDWFGSREGIQFESRSGQKKVLLVDDSPFFRNMLSPMLLVTGYQVVSVQSANEALRLCSAGETFDVIISDIEMPDMNGFDFARKVKSSDSRWKDTPLVALSSHATAQDIDRGREAGFNDHIPKLDREALLRSIAQIQEVS